jgi:hypothetical protein
LPVNSEKIEGDGGVYAKIKYRSNCWPRDIVYYFTTTAKVLFRLLRQVVRKEMSFVGYFWWQQSAC